GPPGPPPGGWGTPPSMPPPPAPRRDRLALGIVAFIFGGLFLVFFGFLFLAYGAVRGETTAISGGPRIGVIEVKGQIGAAGGVDADHVMKQIRKFAADDELKAVVVRVDSPGGAVGPSQEIYDEVRRLAAKKTVVCSMGSMAASGGLYVSMGCPRIVAEPGTLTGSIGVISMFPNVKVLADKLGVRVETIKTGALKDAGNPFREMTAADRAYWQGLVEDTLVQFVKAVADGRKLDEAKVRAIADGRAMTGAQAKEAGLVDRLGNFYDAVELAKTEAKLTGEPNLVYPPDDRGRLFEQLFGDAASSAADAIATRLEQRTAAAQQPGMYFLAR
ncbi:signal peptide peptidase SppA, partial [Anaeromyxobacter oryzisoli]|uniref:signal peptide peptidase SppA n=1 Tax=Anaeromyxobacter oryzisoli TaxID=2925408 RepID=UPI001F56319F